MAQRPPTTEPHYERPGPAEFRDPLIRREMAKAAVWLGMALLIAGIIVLAQPLLLIVGGAIFAVFLDGGTRLLGRVLPIPRGWRLLLVILLGFVFIGQFSFLQNIVKPNWRVRTGLAGAPLLGIVFAVGWSPCYGPTLPAISALSFNSGSPWQGAVLALAYALGLGIPFLLIALGLGWAASAVAFLKRHMRVVNIIGGILLIVIGILMVTGLWNSWVLSFQGVLPDFVPAV